MVPPQPVVVARRREPALAPRVIPLPGGRKRGYNPVDVIALVYLGVTCVLLVAGRAHLPEWKTYLAAHALLLGGVAALRLCPHLGRFPLQFVRESYPLWLMPLAYHELSRINRLVTLRYYDAAVVRWDQIVFGGHPQTYLAALLPNVWLSEFLHCCYLSYMLFIPLVGLTLYFQRRTEAFRVFTTTVALTMYSSYLVFAFFPVQGPWYTFPHPVIAKGVFGSLVRTYLLRGASIGCAFPSSHVAVAASVAIMAHRFSRRLSYALLILAAGIAVGTVYGGFHYAIDALCGLLFGLGTALLGPRLHRALLRRHRLPHIRMRFPHLHLR